MKVNGQIVQKKKEKWKGHPETTSRLVSTCFFKPHQQWILDKKLLYGDQQWHPLITPLILSDNPDHMTIQRLRTAIRCALSAFNVSTTKPVKVFKETSFLVLPNRPSENFRELVWGNWGRVNERVRGHETDGDEDEEGQALTNRFSIVERTWEKYNCHLMAAVLLLVSQDISVGDVKYTGFMFHDKNVKEDPKPSIWQKDQTGIHSRLSQSRDHLWWEEEELCPPVQRQSNTNRSNKAFGVRGGSVTTHHKYQSPTSHYSSG